MAEIRFEKVCKFFDKARIIEDLDLTIQDGKFTVLVGASGCGKATLLRMIAGIGPATSGHIYMDGKDMGENIYVHVNDEHLYFFDTEGQRIRKADGEEAYAQLLKNAGGMSNV